MCGMLRLNGESSGGLELSRAQFVRDIIASQRVYCCLMSTYSFDLRRMIADIPEIFSRHFFPCHSSSHGKEVSEFVLVFLDFLGKV